MAYKDMVLASGAVGLWELSETSGSFPDLYTASPHAMTVTGAVTREVAALYSDGPPAVKFNGTGTNISTTAFGSVNGSFSVEAIIRYDTMPVAASAIFGRTNNTSFNGAWNLRVHVEPSGSISCYLQDSSSSVKIAFTSAGLITAGTTFHLAVVFTASTSISIWLNGASVGLLATPTSSATLSGMGVFAAGVGYGATPMTSTVKMSQLAAYSKALSENEVLQHAAAVIPGVGTRINATLTAPQPRLLANRGGVVDAQCPAQKVFAYCGGTVVIAAKMQVLTASARQGVNGSLTVKPPMQRVAGFFGAQAALLAPVGTVSSSATGTAFISAELTAPMQRVIAEGRVSNTGSVRAIPPMAKVVGYFGSVCNITLTGKPTVTASVTSGSIGRAQVVCPLFEVVASATQNAYASAELVAPMGRTLVGGVAHLLAPMAKLVSIGTATVTATYEAYAVNLNHTSDSPVDEVTHYTNFPFTHVVRYKNSYYGVAAGGLYLLEGTTDAGAPIAWQFKTGITDFGTANLKTVTYAYFGGRFGPGATVSIYPGESGGNSYSYTTPRGQAAQNYRQQFGRGLKARYFAVGASGTDALELDSLELITDTLSRRI